MNTKVKQITHGAMLIAVIIALLIVNRQLAGAINVLFWFLALPMIVYNCKYGMKLSIVVFFSSLFTAFLLSTLLDILFLFEALLTGIFYGYAVRKKYSNKILLSLSIVLAVLSSWLILLIVSSFLGYDIYSEYELIINLIRSTGIAVDFTGVIKMFIFVSITGIGILQGIVIHVFAHIALPRLKIEIPPLKPLQSIVYPKWSAYVIMAIWVVYLMSRLGFIPLAFSGYIYIMFMVAFLVGISAGAIMLITYGIKKQSKIFVFLVIMACFVPVLNNLIFCLGVYDIYADMRHNEKVGE